MIRVIWQELPSQGLKIKFLPLSLGLFPIGLELTLPGLRDFQEINYPD